MQFYFAFFFFCRFSLNICAHVAGAGASVTNDKRFTHVEVNVTPTAHTHTRRTQTRENEIVEAFVRSYHVRMANESFKFLGRCVGIVCQTSTSSWLDQCIKLTVMATRTFTSMNRKSWKRRKSQIIIHLPLQLTECLLIHTEVHRTWFGSAPRITRFLIIIIIFVNCLVRDFRGKGRERRTYRQRPHSMRIDIVALFKWVVHK